jgi:hypothetical protein
MGITRKMGTAIGALGVVVAYVAIIAVLMYPVLDAGGYLAA